MGAPLKGPGNGGNNGTVQINGADIKNGNDPHLTCPITIKWSGFDAGPPDNEYTVTFTGINPTGGTITTVAPSDATTGTFAGTGTTKSYSLQIANGSPNHKGEYHANITVMTKTANGSESKSKTVWLGSCNVINPISGGTVAVTGACTSNNVNSGYTWSVVATKKAGATTADVAGTASPGGSFTTDVTTGLGSFTTAAGQNATTVALDAASIAAGWTISQPAAAPAACGVAGVVDPTADATSTCSAMSVHLAAGTNATTFDITEPAGTHQVLVGAGQTQDVSYTPGAGLTVSVSANGKQLDTATAPGSCSNPGQADPQVAADNKCKSGINLTLSNMNGTADTTFTVTSNGTTKTYTVRAGQVKKLSYAVKEDTKGSVTVSAPGLAKKTFSYAKDCAAVLGVKHTRRPAHPVVQGEKSQLPFTGFDTRRALFDGAALTLLGGMLCGLAARREGKRQVGA